MKNIEIQTQGGQTVVTDTVTVQPVSQSVSRIGKTWGFVWNRPYAVRVEQGETSYQIPIRDYTQIGLAVLYGLTVLFGLMAVWKSLSQRR